MRPECSFSLHVLSKHLIIEQARNDALKLGLVLQHDPKGDVRGERNLELAEKVLAKRSISVSSRDVGGTKGRKIVFDGRTGHVAVMKVHKLRKEDWLA